MKERQVHSVRVGAEVNLAREVSKLVPGVIKDMKRRGFGRPIKRRTTSGLLRTTFCACGNDKDRAAMRCRTCWLAMNQQGSETLARRVAPNIVRLPEHESKSTVMSGFHVHAPSHPHPQPPLSHWVKGPDGTWKKDEQED